VQLFEAIQTRGIESVQIGIDGIEVNAESLGDSHGVQTSVKEQDSFSAPAFGTIKLVKQAV
jgi:hypothetical protein